MNIVGNRTYILAFGAVVAAAVSFLTGEITLAQAVNDGLMGAGLGTLRAGFAGLGALRAGVAGK